MKKYFISICFVTLMTFTGWSQNKDATVITIEDEKITVDEFLSVFNKNNPENENSKEALEEYLDLYINYKLKVKEAERLGYDTIKELQEELQGYREQLAEPYLIDEEANQKLLREAYDRMQHDVRASHILFRAGENAAPEDTLKAYNKAMEVREKALAGQDFGDLAVEHSEDPSARERAQQGRKIPGNQGDLGYFTVFDMVYPFESAAYKLEPGSISKPVRTRFGYHIIKVEDKRDALGEVKVAHILKVLTQAKDAQDSLKMKHEIDSIHTLLKEGADFTRLVKKHSDDKASAKKGGELPAFTSNRMIPSFVKAVDQLEEEGDISKPFKSRYGWHIVKLIEHKPIGSFEENKEEIKRQISKSDRADKSQESLIKKLQKEYSASMNEKAALAIKNFMDKGYFNKEWNADTVKNLQAIVFEIGDASFTQYDFARYLEKTMKRTQSQDFEVMLRKKFNTFVDEKTLAYEKDRLEEKYPEFKRLLKEYRDGILLFELTNDKVWNKAVEDTAGLKAFHEKRKENYMWDERAKATIVTILDEEVLEKARELAAKGKSGEEIKKALNDSTRQTVMVQDGKFEKDANEKIETVKWEKGLSDVHTHKDRKFFVYIHHFADPEPKTLKEARGAITADYQNYLEEKWLEELRNRYDFKVHQRVFDKIEL
ncbi:MAG: peptidylprolyl isomerase [Bacteroidota bacterium]